VGGGNASKRTPPSPGTKTPSGTREWKCGVTCKAEPKRRNGRLDIVSVLRSA
jgi:hypothetical protein